MYRGISVAMLLFSILSLRAGEARADSVFAEPDAAADGVDLTFAYPGVILTVDGEPDRVVRAAVGFSEFNSRNLATTGVLVFNQDPPAPGGPPEVVPLTFAFDPNIGPLRAEFLVPTDFVRIDMACDDDDFGEMRAFDASDNLLAFSNRVTCDGRTADANGTAVINRSMADIAYITAGGIGSEGLFLDNLQFNLSTPTCDVELSQEIYLERQTITADVFRLANTSSSQVPVEVNAWIVTAGLEPLKVTTLQPRRMYRLEPESVEDIGPKRLARVRDLPSGPGQIICRLIDPRNGGVYDVEVAPFEIQ
jgi:hypothetical protein